MKISKLFHWLYAFIMALPIFAILSTCLISTFNMSSKQESKIVYKYETNEVTQASELIVGNIYHYKRSMTSITTGSNFLRSGNIFNVIGTVDTSITTNGIDEFICNKVTDTRVQISNNNPYSNVSQIYNLDSYFECDLIFSTIIANDNYSYYSISNFNVIENVETNNVNTQDIFYEAIDKVKVNSLFSWAYNSFLSAPLVYIVGLFSIPTNSIFVEMLSYWLAISVIWLVFDLIMWIPLLAHRWLDKGVLE